MVWITYRAAAIPRGKGGARFQMKLVYNHLAPLFLFLLQWIDCSCTCLLPRYLNFFHILVYKVVSSSLISSLLVLTEKEFAFVALPNLGMPFHYLLFYLIQVYTDGRPTISTHGRKATIRDFYCMLNLAIF